MYFDFSVIPDEARDKLLHSVVVPRPIAWVSTIDAEGGRNLAPFSFFNVFCAAPPIVGVGVTRRGPGTRKDTARNVRETKEFVVNMVGYALRSAMNITATDAAPGVDEIDLAGLDMETSTHVGPGRVAASPASMECVLHEIVELAPDCDLILGRVVAMHIADDMIEDVAKFYVDAPKLDLIGRMHGSGWYARTDHLFQMKRV